MAKNAKDKIDSIVCTWLIGTDRDLSLQHICLDWFVNLKEQIRSRAQKKIPAIGTGILSFLN
jgi:hypothetical protein